MRQPFKDLFFNRNVLESDSRGKPAQQQLRLAVATLLWDMSMADGERSPAEFVEIVRLLDHEFHIMDDEAGKLLQASQVLSHYHDHLERALGEINRGYNRDQKEYLIELLIKLAKADGHIDESEREFASYLREKLNLEQKRK